MASALALVPMVTGFPQVSVPARAHPVTSHIHKVGFVKSSVAALRTARNATGSVGQSPGATDPVTTARAAAVTPVQDVAGPVTVVGVTWPRGTVSAHGQFQIRTLSGSTWSQWQPLGREDGGPDSAEAAGASATVGTDPYVVTGASKYEVRSLTTDAAMPAAATVQAVDPGTSSADTVQPVPGAASAATVRPQILTRAQWGANESLRRVAPSYGVIQVGFVHHTDSANSYTASEVPAMIRGMYAYHVQTLGWNDIGYNFLVDRFGRTWEGRFGGMDRAVVGAQTLNYNAVSMGVAAIGNFDVAVVPQAMTNAFQAIFAWKFSLSGVPATVSSQVVAFGKYLQRISGHRDAFSTACPGQYLYARLAEIRAGAAAIMGAQPPVPVKPPVVKPPVVKPPVVKPPVVKPPVVKPPVVRPVVKPWAVTVYTPFKGVVRQQGSKGAAVVVLQRGLKVTPDGDFGSRTRVALVAFQRQQHISPNGVASRIVWDRLEKLYYPLFAYRGLTLRQGSTGAVVAVLQRAVRAHADGMFGAKTLAAVRTVQRSAKLTQTGVVSGWTWVAIENRMPR